MPRDDNTALWLVHGILRLLKIVLNVRTDYEPDYTGIISIYSYRGKIVPVNARQQGISSRIHYVRQTRLISEHPPYSYLERSSIQLLAYSFVRSFLMSTFGRRRLIANASCWTFVGALFTHRHSFEKRRVEKAWLYRAARRGRRRDTWTWTWNGVGWVVERVVYGDRHDTYSRGGLSFLLLLLLFLLPTFPPSLSRLCPCTSKTRAIFTQRW